jgi:hypothetical protein
MRRDNEPSLWRATRLPLVVLAVAGVAIAAATLLDRTTAREWALTIGGPALTVLLPVGTVWLVVAVIVYVVRRNRAASSK